MFDIGFGELLMLFVVGMFVFGPDKLPKIAADMGRMLRQVRRMAAQARSDLKEHLGPEIGDLDVRDLNPRRAVQRMVWDDDDDEPNGTRPSATSSPQSQPPVTPGERPPYDADAT